MEVGMSDLTREQDLLISRLIGAAEGVMLTALDVPDPVLHLRPLPYPRDEEEKEALRALAQLLRSGRPIDSLRATLANLFDPDAGTERKLVFKFRREGGQRSKSFEHKQIAYFIGRAAREDGEGVEAAVQKAMKVYRLDRDTTYKILRRYRSWVEETLGPIS
jgi:hypothetical protein